MRKLPLQQKVTKNVEIKRLQKEVHTLREQERAREDEVEKQKSKSKWLTDFIHIIQQKIQGMVQSIEVKLLEHVRSDQVEQLAMQVEEVAKDITKVQKMVQTFQDKVHPAAQPETLLTT